MKKALKQLFHSIGLEISRKSVEPTAGSMARPICNIEMFLEDIKARGFLPKGIIDVGANRGDWTQMALKIFPDTKILMIEPQDEMEVCLNKLCAQNPKLYYIKAGAGKEEGELIQTIWEDLAGSSFLPESEETKLHGGLQRYTKIITIDNILKKFPLFCPDLIKLDIQGFELEALKGANTLFGIPEIFILETSLYRFLPQQPLISEVIEFMHARGYEIYDMSDFLRRPYDGALGQIDIVFAKRDGVLRQSSKWDNE